MTRGGKLFVWVFVFGLWAKSVLADDTKLQFYYTVVPNQSFLSGKLVNGYDKKYSGGLHSLMEAIATDININAKYIPYSNYNQAIQNTMIFDSEDRPEIFVGALFDEDKLKYLDFLPYPVARDYKVLVVNKTALPLSFKEVKKDFLKSIALLSLYGKPVLIREQVFPNVKVKEFVVSDDISGAMEKVFLSNNFLITNWYSVLDYLEKNKGASKLDSVVILQYPSEEVKYLVAVNKKSKLFTEKSKENILMIERIEQLLKNFITTNTVSEIMKNE